MKIVIAGAGEVGFHLTQLLARENQDITLIDTDEDVLEHVASHLDVRIVKGDVASLEVLEQCKVGLSNLFLAVTTSEKTNLLTTILAKQMGATKTIARIDNPEYLKTEQKKRFKNLGIDVLISPDHLAAFEIKRLLERYSFTDIFEFEEGKICIAGFTLDRVSPLIHQPLSKIYEFMPDFSFKVVAILRDHLTIIPNGEIKLSSGDHLYLAATKSDIDQITHFIGKRHKKIKNIMIIGGTRMALRTAQLLENIYHVSLVEKDKKTAQRLNEQLHNTLVIRANLDNINVLIEENMENMDAFVALTSNSETNIISSLMAREMKIGKTIALVDNSAYTHISQNIGVDTLINKKIIAANNIFRHVRKGKVEAIASLHGVEAEIIEFVIHKNNRLTKHPLKDLHFPQKMIIAGVVRGNKSFIPDENFRLELDDKVIVFTQLEAINAVEKIFK